MLGRIKWQNYVRRKLESINAADAMHKPHALYRTSPKPRNAKRNEHVRRRAQNRFSIQRIECAKHTDLRSAKTEIMRMQKEIRA